MTSDFGTKQIDAQPIVGIRTQTTMGKISPPPANNPILNDPPCLKKTLVSTDRTGVVESGGT